MTKKNDDYLIPSLGVLVKLGSIVIHYEEWTSPSGHPVDKTALDGLIADPEVREWITRMDKFAMLPKKR